MVRFSEIDLFQGPFFNLYGLIHRVTGFASAKVGRLAAFTIGGAIILLEVANEQGIIKIDWNRLYRKVDEAGDKVQEKLTGDGPKWVEKVSSIIEIFQNTILSVVFLKPCKNRYG